MCTLATTRHSNSLNCIRCWITVGLISECDAVAVHIGGRQLVHDGLPVLNMDKGPSNNFEGRVLNLLDPSIALVKLAQFVVAACLTSVEWT